MVGTVRRKKPELPPALVSKADWARFSSKFAFTESDALVSYNPRKQRNALLVSNRDDKRPKIIKDYNRNQGGVNNLDEVMHFHYS